METKRNEKITRLLGNNTELERPDITDIKENILSGDKNIIINGNLIINQNPDTSVNHITIEQLHQLMDQYADITAILDAISQHNKGDQP